MEDSAVLCGSDGGQNKTPACVTKVEALAINKMWYGHTADGHVPHPAVDNGQGTRLAPGQLWFAPSRGARLVDEPGGVADSKDGQGRPVPVGLPQIAISLQNPKLAGPDLKNAAGNGENGWRKLTYADLARAQTEAARLSKELGPFYGDDPDLTRFKARGGKMIVSHGMADEEVPIAGTTEYYGRVIEKFGSLAAVQEFYRYFQVPGLGHFGVTPVQGLPGVSPKSEPPTPDGTEMFNALVAWVEKGIAPEGFVMTNASKSISRPLCL
jgi:feruloyl esterase